jgi:putative ABC transport system ATP-binding protein
VIEIRGARKHFGAGTEDARIALDGVDLVLAKGDFAVVIGSNGAGKSTLLNAVAGAIPLDAGTIRIDGRDVTELPVHRRAAHIARVFQDPLNGTFAAMTVEENLLLAELRGRRRGLAWALSAVRRRRWREALAAFGLGLEARLKSRVEQLSGGQRQSLALAMAALNEPPVLLLDEHTAALDPRTARLVMEATVALIARARLSAIMVTHNMHQAIAHGNRLLMMEEGRIKLELAGEEKRRLTVEDLVSRFGAADDRLVLSR